MQLNWVKLDDNWRETNFYLHKGVRNVLFLKGHGEDGGLLDKLGSCNFIWTKLDDIWRKKKILSPGVQDRFGW